MLLPQILETPRLKRHIKFIHRFSYWYVRLSYTDGSIKARGNHEPFTLPCCHAWCRNQCRGFPKFAQRSSLCRCWLQSSGRKPWGGRCIKRWCWPRTSVHQKSLQADMGRKQSLPRQEVCCTRSGQLRPTSVLRQNK